ncbi:MAG: NADH-quinone oxidoreductase subunit C [Planctomycetaceae bacterium]
MSSVSLIEVVTQSLPAAVSSSHAWRGDQTLVVRPESLVEVATLLRDEPSLQMGFLMDLTAVDYSTFDDGAAPAFFASSGVAVKPISGIRDENPWSEPSTTRFVVVYHFYSVQHKHRLRLIVPVDEEQAEVDSLTPLWPGANWLEREVWDMFGIRFRGHPDLRRILMYDEFEGHPLRKDYRVDKRQPLVQPIGRQEE